MFDDNQGSFVQESDEFALHQENSNHQDEYVNLAFME